MTGLPTPGNPPAGTPPMAGRVLIAATAAFLVFAPFASSAGWRSAMLLAAGLAIAVDHRRCQADVAAIPRSVAIAWAAWSALAVASVAWSDRPSYSLTELRSELLYGTLALFAFFIAAREVAQWRLWWNALILGSLLVLVAQVLQNVMPIRISRHQIDGGSGPWSTHLVLIAPLLLALSWPRPWGQERKPFVLAIASAVLLGAAWASDNRIVWGALAAQLVIAGALHRAMPFTEPRRSLRIIVVFALLLIAVALPASIIERSARHYPGAASVTDIERDLRPVIWSVAWEKFKASPIHGYGYGREIVESTFLPHTPKNVDHPPVQHAHNVFIDMALELGVLGLAAFSALLVAIGNQYRRFLRDPAVAPLGLLGLAILAGFLVKCLTDDFLHRHNALVFWALNGMLLGFGCRLRAATEKAD